jgi:hypothetical protein
MIIHTDGFDVESEQEAAGKPFIKKGRLFTSLAAGPLTSRPAVAAQGIPRK